MKIQNIGVNNYNYSNQKANSNNQPAFKQNVFGYIGFEKGEIAPFRLPNRLKEAFLRFVTNNRFIDSPNIFMNRVFWGRGLTNCSLPNQGMISVVDRTSAFAQSRLAKLPPGTEAKYNEWQELHRAFREGRLEKLPDDLSITFGDCRRHCSKLVTDVANNAPDSIKFNIPIATLEVIAKKSQNLPNKNGMVQVVPLWFAP